MTPHFPGLVQALHCMVWGLGNYFLWAQASPLNEKIPRVNKCQPSHITGQTEKTRLAVVFSK